MEVSTRGAAFFYMKASAKYPKVAWLEVIYPFKSFWVFLLVNLACGLVINLIFSLSHLNRWEDFAISIGGSTLIFLTLWMGNAYIGAWIGHRVSWLKEPLKRLFLSTVSMVIYTVLAFLAVQLLLRLIFFQQIPGDLIQWTIDNSATPLIISFGASWAFSARSFYLSWKTSESRARQLNTEMLTYRYEALRNQINPHFLFNSFNVLSDLVYEDQELAVKFIRQMSDLYRYVLDSREKEKVTLANELEFLRSFVFLNEIRFEEKLSVEIDLEPQEGEMIVPMALQLLLENAVKHNVATKQKPLWVKVTRQGNGLVVRNNLQPRSVGEDSKKIGLKNLEQQYAHHSGRKIKVKAADGEFSVWVPILAGGEA